MPHVDAGDTAWVLASTALVLFMTPGLAFFYGGMVRRKNVLGMLMQNYVVIGIVSVAWVWLAYSLAFGVDWGGHGLIGTFHFAGLAHIDTQSVPGYAGATAQTIPPLVFVIFQMMFAIITVGLITGSSAVGLRVTAEEEQLGLDFFHGPSRGAGLRRPRPNVVTLDTLAWVIRSFDEGYTVASAGSASVIGDGLNPLTMR